LARGYYSHSLRAYMSIRPRYHNNRGSSRRASWVFEGCSSIKSWFRGWFSTRKMHTNMTKQT